MTRILEHKILENTRLATTYGGWMYCTNCNKNIGYLCYVTYDRFSLNYECLCGSKGIALLDFKDSKEGIKIKEELVVLKNRFCCGDDGSPLVTMMPKNLKSYHFEITCKSCNKLYNKDFSTIL